MGIHKKSRNQEETGHVWTVNGKRHHTTEPAIVTEVLEEWYFNDKLHRLGDDLPSHIGYYGSDRTTIYKRLWTTMGFTHRVGKPACIIYYGSGAIEAEYWWHNGQISRLDGPACTTYDPTGNALEEDWYINGNELFEKDDLIEALTREGVSKQDIAALILKYNMPTLDP